MAPSLGLPILVGILSAGLVNYFADELPRTRRLGRPSCRGCGGTYHWLGYIIGQACRSCGKHRGPRPWIVLGSITALSVFSWLQPPRIGFLLGSLLLAYFAVSVVIDVEHRLILQPTSVFGGLLALGLGWWLHGFGPTVLGGLAGFAIMTALYYLGVVFARFRSNRLATADGAPYGQEALGTGDVTLAGILGLLLGWPLIWFGLLLGVLLGGIMVLVIVGVELARGHSTRRALMVFMPFGPSLVLSAFLILFLPGILAAFLPR